MDLRQIEAFVSVATFRNFRVAASRLHISQPAVSQRLASLEAELEVQLFNRSGRQVQLTAKGMQLLQLAEQVLDAAGTLKSRAAGAQPPAQKIRVGATSAIANAWMPNLFLEMSRVFPSLTIELVVETSPKLRVMLINGELDLAIMMGPTHSAGVRNFPLARYGTAWVASRKLILPKDMKLEELAGYRIITHARDSATFGSLEELFRNGGLWPVELSSTNSIGALLRIVEANGAIGAVCSAVLNGKVGKSGPLQIISTESDLPEFQFFASCHTVSVGRVGRIVAEMAQKVCWSVASKTPHTFAQHKTS